jgi:aryl-alcohol dehydrogenase-like predicted oxidoreductase
MSKKKRIDPIPDEFSSYEEAAQFWDTHDTTDYPDAFRTVKMVSELRGRRYEIELDADIVAALKTQARRKGVSLSQLASDLLRKQLPVSK